MDASDIRSPLGSRAVDHVLQVLALNPHRPYFTRELARITGDHVNGVANALRRLVMDGALRTISLGGRRGFQFDDAGPYAEELRRIALKSLGVPRLLDEAGVTASLVVVYGSAASGGLNESSDVDILVIGKEPHRGAAEAALNALTGRVERDISVRVIAASDARREREREDSFVGAALDGPVVALLGRP